MFKTRKRRSLLFVYYIFKCENRQFCFSDSCIDGEKKYRKVFCTYTHIGIRNPFLGRRILATSMAIDI